VSTITGRQLGFAAVRNEEVLEHRHIKVHRRRGPALLISHAKLSWNNKIPAIEEETMGAGLAQQDYASRFFENDSRPGGILSFKGGRPISPFMQSLTATAVHGYKLSYAADWVTLDNFHRDDRGA
jgi:hypothetical protein